MKLTDIKKRQYVKKTTIWVTLWIIRLYGFKEMTCEIKDEEKNDLGSRWMQKLFFAKYIFDEERKNITP